MRNLQIAIQRWLRKLLGVPSTVDMEYAIVKAQEEARQLIRRKSGEWDAREAELNRVAGDMTLAIYDAVEKIMAEIAEAKREIIRPRYDESKGDKPLDKE